MAEQEWKEVPGTPFYPFFKFKVAGDKIAGKIIGKRQLPGLEAGKIQDVVDLQTKDGEYTIGLTADLQEKVGKLDLGRMVKIEMTGTKKVPGKPSPMKTFVVQVAS